jgi:hypothetical protein
MGTTSRPADEKHRVNGSFASSSRLPPWRTQLNPSMLLADNNANMKVKLKAPYPAMAPTM